MYTLGFTTEYYTLWEVSEPQKKYTAGATINGVFTGSFYMVVNCTYIQNLSKDHATALKKIEEMSGGKYGVDLDLRGHSSFTRTLPGTNSNDMPEYVFTFGKLMGHDIREAVDVWQLNRAVKEEKGSRRKALARKRLIELGELVRNTVASMRYVGNWVTPSHLKYLQSQEVKANATGHYFENGKRIRVSVRRIGGTSWTGQYGYRETTTYLEEYITEDGKLLKYKGSSPLSVSEEGYTVVVGTVEHGEYKGQPETRLKRMKLSTVEV